MSVGSGSAALAMGSSAGSSVKSMTSGSAPRCCRCWCVCADAVPPNALLWWLVPGWLAEPLELKPDGWLAGWLCSAEKPGADWLLLAAGWLAALDKWAGSSASTRLLYSSLPRAWNSVRPCKRESAFNYPKGACTWSCASC